MFGLTPAPVGGYEAVEGPSVFLRDVMMIDEFNIGHLIKDIIFGFDFTFPAGCTKPEPRTIIDSTSQFFAPGALTSMTNNLRSATIYGTDKTALYVSVLEALGPNCQKLTDLSVMWTWKKLPERECSRAECTLPQKLKKLKMELQVKQTAEEGFNLNNYRTLGHMVEKMVSSSSETLLELDISITNAIDMYDEGIRWKKFLLAGCREQYPLRRLKSFKYHLSLSDTCGQIFIDPGIPKVFAFTEEIHLEQPRSGAYLKYDLKREAENKDPIIMTFKKSIDPLEVDNNGEDEGPNRIIIHISIFFRGLRCCKRLYIDFDTVDDKLRYCEFENVLDNHMSFMEVVKKAVLMRVHMMLRFADIMRVLELAVWPFRHEKLSVNLTMKVKRDEHGDVKFIDLDCDCEELWHVLRTALVNYWQSKHSPCDISRL